MRFCLTYTAHASAHTNCLVLRRLMFVPVACAFQRRSNGTVTPVFGMQRVVASPTLHMLVHTPTVSPCVGSGLLILRVRSNGTVTLFWGSQRAVEVLQWRAVHGSRGAD